ncbi:GntR family transcriptional regulator [Pseudomonas mangiferae]|uniref:GntR family transcriptional regulator n=1 Tax=Pseudomonas mangiferae TaxID=2593654 RepID=A0A553GUP2_9PSED|nr:GntR family transcriptional regulator [Pseudomonas mangiferae]TRX73166.1 GntR family transcriptional regulator [Pseudomonas mangiferae]
MTFTAPDSLAEQIAHHLAERIVRGELKARERIQEIKVTQALNVSRGPVREALLILERRHLVRILPRRGAQVAELTAHKVTSLYALMASLYVMLGRAVALNWKDERELDPFLHIRRRLVENRERDDIGSFAEVSFGILREAFPFADNPYLQETLENLIPVISRTYYLALERRRGEMSQTLAALDTLLQAIVEHDADRVERVVLAYVKHNRDLVLAALIER